MNINEVPQDDDGFLKAGKVRDVCYALDENGNYKQVLSLGWKPKNDALKQAWEQINEKVEAVRQQALQGKLSPIAYYLEKNLMTPAILAQYTGIAGWRVKRHLNPAVFKKLKPAVLQKYAEVFNLSVEELMQV